jgi:hypothetical protein
MLGRWLSAAVLRVMLAGLGVVRQGVAQQRNASPLIRGVLIERAVLPSGEFSVRASDNEVFRYRFDPKTYVEREDRLVDIPRLDIGEKVEVLSDEGPASGVRYARTVHVIFQQPRRRPSSEGRPGAGRSPADYFAPISTMSISGVVSRLSPDRLILHTRAAGNQTILLRRDTRYLDNGQTVDGTALQPTMRVFIRAGRNLYNEIEAYQIIWGDILQPR